MAKKLYYMILRKCIMFEKESTGCVDLHDSKFPQWCCSESSSSDMWRVSPGQRLTMIFQNLRQHSITTRRPEFSYVDFSFTGNACPKCLQLFCYPIYMQNRKKSHILSYETKHHSKNSALHKI